MPARFGVGGKTGKGTAARKAAVSRSGAVRRPPPEWRTTLAILAATTVLEAAFPRLAHWARWPTRLGLRGRLLYIAFNAALGFGLRELARRMGELEERTVAELRNRLGREPTADEIRSHRVRQILRYQLGREPTDQEVRNLSNVMRQ